MDPDLDAITEKLVEKYKAFKSAEGEKDAEKKTFFDACNELVGANDLARQTVRLPESSEDSPLDIEQYIGTFYPGWRLIEGRAATAVIEEDPSFKPYVHINRDLGMVVKREVSQAGPSLDDERLRSEDPDLWKRITKPARVIKDLSAVSDTDIGKLSKYFVPGKKTVKLAAPRKAKPDELDA